MSHPDIIPLPPRTPSTLHTLHTTPFLHPLEVFERMKTKNQNVSYGICCAFCGKVYPVISSGREYQLTGSSETCEGYAKIAHMLGYSATLEFLDVVKEDNSMYVKECVLIKSKLTKTLTTPARS
jgi:hypothetical protein